MCFLGICGNTVTKMHVKPTEESLDAERGRVKRSLKVAEKGRATRADNLNYGRFISPNSIPSKTSEDDNNHEVDDGGNAKSRVLKSGSTSNRGRRTDTIQDKVSKKGGWYFVTKPDGRVKKLKVVDTSSGEESAKRPGPYYSKTYYQQTNNLILFSV